MQETDRIVRAMNEEKNVRLLLARTTRLVEEARRRHHTTPTATAALGRVLTAAVMIGADIKGAETVTLRVNGGGPLGTLLAVACGDGTVRGYVAEPAVDVPEKWPGKLDVGSAVGNNGHLEVIKDLGLKNPFTGTVPLVSGEIAEDLAYYFTLSEQIPSLVALGVYVERDHSVGAAGGLIIQAMPGANDEVLRLIEDRVQHLGPITGLLRQEQLETVVDVVFQGIAHEVIDSKPLAFRCRCNRERVTSIIAALSDEDIHQALKTRGKLEVTCNFCNEAYDFTAEDVARIRAGTGTLGS